MRYHFVGVRLFFTAGFEIQTIVTAHADGETTNAYLLHADAHFTQSSSDCEMAI